MGILIITAMLILTTSNFTQHPIPVIDPLVSLPRGGQVVSIPDLVSYDEYRRGRFYQEWLRPQRWKDVAYTVLEKLGPHRAMLLVMVPSKAKGMVDDDMRRRMALVAPHTRRALLISSAMGHQQSTAETFGDTLDDLNNATFLVDARGNVVHANTAGHGMLYANDFLRSLEGKIVARDPEANRTLHEVVAACVHGDARIGPKGIALPLIAHDGERYVAHVLPLTSGERRGTAFAFMAVAALFVRKTGPLYPAEAIARS